MPSNRIDDVDDSSFGLKQHCGLHKLTFCGSVFVVSLIIPRMPVVLLDWRPLDAAVPRVHTTSPELKLATSQVPLAGRLQTAGAVNPVIIIF